MSILWGENRVKVLLTALWISFAGVVQGGLYLVSDTFIIPATTPFSGVATDITVDYSFTVDLCQPDGNYGSPLTTFTMDAPLGSTTFTTANTAAEYTVLGGELRSFRIGETVAGGALGHVTTSRDDFLYLVGKAGGVGALGSAVDLLYTNAAFPSPGFHMDSTPTTTLAIEQIPEPSRAVLLASGFSIALLRRHRKS